MYIYLIKRDSDFWERGEVYGFCEDWEFKL